MFLEIDMNKTEEKVLKKYRREITRIIRNKYKTRANNEARAQKFCLPAKKDVGTRVEDLAKDIYESYIPVMLEEIEIKVNEFYNSYQFKKNVENEKKINKKKVSYKSLKRFQELKIGIHSLLLDKLYEEVNKDGAENPIEKDELKYILLSIIYKVIEYMQNGYKVKIGTLFTIWLEKRDVRVNLPDVETRILEDRLIPKIALCPQFSYRLFQAINKGNTALINYYKAKTERFLLLLKNRAK